MSEGFIIIISLVLSAFFSGMEIAFLSANRLRIQLGKNQGKISDKVLTFFNKYSSFYLGTMLVGNNIALVVYGIYMGKVIVNWFFPYSTSDNLSIFELFIQTLVSTLIILFTAEFLPKSIARINPNRSLNIAWPIIIAFAIILFIPTTITLLFSEGILRVFMIKKEDDKSHLKFGRVDLDDFVKDIAERADSEEEIDHELQIFQNALDFSKVKARDCMVPRTEIVALERESTINELVETFVNTGLSKILIYKDTIDNIIGYVHSSELFKKPEKIKNILLPLFIVPETAPAKKLLEQFIQQKKGVALVVDEYGGTSGMLTIEDVIEEIFGDIEDEHDSDDLIEIQTDEFEYDFSARLEIDYINQKYELELPESEEYETLAGLILNETENIPEQGEIISFNGFEIIVSEVHQNRIERVKLIIKAKVE